MKTRINTRTASGFTLLELVLGLTILAMLSGTVYSIISGAVQTASRMRVSQSENDQVSHFIRLCRQSFQSLPSTASLTIKTGDSSGAQQEVTISGSPEIFSFGPNPMSYKDTIIGLRPDAAATELAEDKQTAFSLGITREDIVPTDPGQNAASVRSGGEGMLAPDEQGRVWVPLLTNVASLTWRAYKNDDEQWVEEWESSDLPLLVEMNLQLTGRSQPIRAVYSLPVLKLAGANKSLAPKKTSTTSLASNNSNSNAGGATAQRGGGDQGGKGFGGKGSKGGKGGKGGPPGAGGGPRGGGQPGGGRPGGGGATPGAGGAKGGGGTAGAGAAAAAGGGKGK